MAVLGLSLAGLGSYLLGLLCATLTGNTALRAEPTARFARKQCLTVQPLQLNKQTQALCFALAAGRRDCISGKRVSDIRSPIKGTQQQSS